MNLLTYRIVRKPRKKSVTISVSRENEVTVSAPLMISEKMIDEIVRRQSVWIQKRMNVHLELRKRFPSKKYEDGDLFYYLGKAYFLCVYVAAFRSLKLEGEHLRISLTEDDYYDRHRVLPEVLQAWYEAQGTVHIKSRVDLYETKMNLSVKHFEVETVGTFWGRCQGGGRLKFNAKLMMVPPEVLDYVVIHELCHMEHPNHSASFWAEVKRWEPLFKTHRRWLNEHGPFLSF